MNLVRQSHYRTLRRKYFCARRITLKLTKQGDKAWRYSLALGLAGQIITFLQTLGSSCAVASVSNSIYCAMASVDHQRGSAYDDLDIAEDQIRLLTLIPASHEDADIHCHLKKSENFRLTQYEVLLHEWDGPQGKRIIYVNAYLFEVRENLYAALRYLRQHSNPRTLWVPAICTNLSDWTENDGQISLLDTILASASNVLLWSTDSMIMMWEDVIRGPPRHRTRINWTEKIHTSIPMAFRLNPALRVLDSNSISLADR